MMKGLCDQSSPQMRSVGLRSTSGRKDGEDSGEKDDTSKKHVKVLFIFTEVSCLEIHVASTY